MRDIADTLGRMSSDGDGRPAPRRAEDTDPPKVQRAKAQLPGLDESIIDADGKIRIFGYGSLPWRPPFEVDAQHPGTLDGYGRELSVHDVVLRGKDRDGERGVTLGVDAKDGAETPGFVLEIEVQSPEHAAEIVDQFAEREKPPNMPIYTFKRMPITMQDGSVQNCLTCVADRDSHLYIGESWTPEEKAQRSAEADGQNGTNLEDVMKTAQTFRERGLPDAELERIVNMAVAHRVGMDPQARAELEAREPPMVAERLRQAEQTRQLDIPNLAARRAPAPEASARADARASGPAPVESRNAK